MLSHLDGCPVGLNDGCPVGCPVGCVGCDVGCDVGISVLIVITFLMRWPNCSVIYKLPALSRRLKVGPLIDAAVAADPSPVDEPSPLPAIVVIRPVDMVTFLTRLFHLSHIYRLP